MGGEWEGRDMAGRYGEGKLGSETSKLTLAGLRNGSKAPATWIRPLVHLALAKLQKPAPKLYFFKSTSAGSQAPAPGRTLQRSKRRRAHGRGGAGAPRAAGCVPAWPGRDSKACWCDRQGMSWLNIDPEIHLRNEK